LKSIVDNTLIRVAPVILSRDCIEKVITIYCWYVCSRTFGLYMFFNFPYYCNCGVVSLFIFLEKTKQKIVSILESLRLQGRS